MFVCYAMPVCMSSRLCTRVEFRKELNVGGRKIGGSIDFLLCGCGCGWLLWSSQLGDFSRSRSNEKQVNFATFYGKMFGCVTFCRL